MNRITNTKHDVLFATTENATQKSLRFIACRTLSKTGRTLAAKNPMFTLLSLLCLFALSLSAARANVYQPVQNAFNLNLWIVKHGGEWPDFGDVHVAYQGYDAGRKASKYQINITLVNTDKFLHPGGANYQLTFANFLTNYPQWNPNQGCFPQPPLLLGSDTVLKGVTTDIAPGKASVLIALLYVADGSDLGLISLETLHNLSGNVVLQGLGIPTPEPAISLGLDFFDDMEFHCGNKPYPIRIGMDSKGNFTATDVPAGKYDVQVKGDKWLSKMVSVDLTNGDGVLPSLTLPGGDANNDDSVDIADFAILVSAYGSSGGDADFNPQADLNDDGKVDVGDFALIVSNFGETGAQ